MRYTYSRGCLACHLADPARWKRLSRTSCLPWGVIYGDEGYCHIGGGPKGGCHDHFAAQLPNEIPLPVPSKRPPTWWSPPEGQRSSLMGTRGHPHAKVEHWQIEPGSRGHPTSMPCSCSHSCHQGRSLDRCERSPSWHKLERHVTFHDPEEGAPLGEKPHRESQRHLTRAQLEGGDVGPLATQRPELEHSWEMPPTCWGTRDRQGHLPEPSIRNYKLWLD